MSIITIVGAGMMGSAMSMPARDNGHEVRLVGIHNRETIDSINRNLWHPTLKRYLPEGVKAYHIDGLQEALNGADLIICGVSSFGVDWFADNIVPIVPESVPILSITKGMINGENGELIPYPEYMQSRGGRKLNINAVGGPCTSYELADRQNTEVAFCGRDIQTLEMLNEMLGTDYYHITPTLDVMGLECAVAMKNAYALAVSLAVGLNEKVNGEGAAQYYNPQAGLFLQSTREAMKMLQLVGADPESLPYFTGDLYVTIFGGRTRLIGTLLGRGFSYEEARQMLAGITLESIVIAGRAAKAVRDLGKEKDFPLLIHVDDIINGGAEVNIPWDDFK